MLVVNKVAVYHMPSPSFVLLAQLVTSALAVWVAGVLGFCQVDALEWGKVRAFFPVAVAFLGAIFTNIKTLQYANVETFIVFRASTPIIVSIADFLFLGRELPSTRSWVSLLGLVVGAGGYVMTDHAYHVSGYFWVCVWYCVFCFDQIYIKHAVDSVKMESNWGRVYYTNLLAALLLLVKGLYEPSDFPPLDQFDAASSAALAVSCALGVGMSYFAFLCRKLVSASSFTVLGNCCKIVTVLINLAIWDHHAGPEGITCLIFCLGCAYFYKQAPKRAEVKRNEQL
jgi:GDP-mannose transporter